MLARLMAATFGIARAGVGDKRAYAAPARTEPEDDDDNNSSSSTSICSDSDPTDDDDNDTSINSVAASEDGECDHYISCCSNNDVHSGEREAHRVRAVGWDSRVNEVLVSLAVQREAKSNVVFFPGDVMDFRAAMASGAYHEFSDFAYERVADVLGEKFGGDCNVWVIRPARLYQCAFSCFDHFVASNEFGAATAYKSTGCAIKHLLALLESTRRTLRRREVTVATDLPLHLVGFSKGAIVLNQLVTELAICKRSGFKSNNRREGLLADISIYHKFFSKVSSIHWVDGGNGSRCGVLPSDERALAAIHDVSNARLLVHVTPYQFESSARPWIKEEIHEFVQQMRRVHVDVQLKMYYDGEEGSIHSHFQLLRDFEVPSAFSVTKMDAFSSPEHSLPRIPIQSV